MSAYLARTLESLLIEQLQGCHAERSKASSARASEMFQNTGLQLAASLAMIGRGARCRPLDTQKRRTR